MSLVVLLLSGVCAKRGEFPPLVLPQRATGKEPAAEPPPPLLVLL